MTCPGAITALDIILYIIAGIGAIIVLIGLGFGIRQMIRGGGQRAKKSKGHSAKKAAGGSLLYDSDFSVEEDHDYGYAGESHNDYGYAGESQNADES